MNVFKTDSHKALSNQNTLFEFLTPPRTIPTRRSEKYCKIITKISKSENINRTNKILIECNYFLSRKERFNFI